MATNRALLPHRLRLRAVLSAVLLAAAGEVRAVPVFLETDHAHINVRSDGVALLVEAEWDSSEGSSRAPLGDAIFVVNSLARATLPASLPPSFSFLGAPGDIVWRTRNSFLAGTIYFGLSGYGTAPGTLVSDRANLQMTGYVGPGGNFFLYDSIAGVPSIHFDSRTGPPHGTFAINSGSHYHPFMVMQRRGIHRVELRATATLAFDGSPLQSTTDHALFLVEPTPYQRWAAAMFRAAAVEPLAAPGADPDGDGLDNTLEYAFGADPLIPDAPVHGPRVHAFRDAPGSPEHLVIDFRRATDAVSDRSDLTLRVEAGNLSAPWSTLDLGTQTVVPAPDPDADGVSRVRVRDTATLPQPAGRFLRVVAELVP